MDIIIILALVIFFIGIIIAFWIGSKVGEFKKHREWEGQIDGIRNDAVIRSRAVLSGNFSEQLAPYLPGFNYNPSDCKFIGKPVDFVVFKGLNEKEIKEVVFLEVKSGDSKLSPTQKNLRDVIENGNIKWDEYRIPKGLTEKRD